MQIPLSQIYKEKHQVLRTFRYQNDSHCSGDYCKVDYIRHLIDNSPITWIRYGNINQQISHNEQQWKLVIQTVGKPGTNNASPGVNVTEAIREVEVTLHPSFVPNQIRLTGSQPKVNRRVVNVTDRTPV